MRTAVITLLSASVFAISVGFAGHAVQQGLKQFRQADRYVTVKGLSERDVVADVAIWPLPILATGDDLAAVQANIDDATTKARAFLIAQGFEDTEIKIQKTEVTDLLAQAYRSGDTGQARYIIRQSLAVETSKIATVLAAQGKIGELFKQGVVVDTAPAKYVYKGLNSIKPEMIAEATENARQGAEQFANDSKATLGGIKTASQGQFQIMPADSEFQYDEGQSPNKKIRVVTTVQYDLFQK